MKKCPQCNRTYADESITFCLADGALLDAPYNSEATQRISSRPSNSPQATEILPPLESHRLKQNQHSRFIYAVVGAMTLLIIVLASIIIVPLMSKDQKENKNILQANGANNIALNESSNLDARRRVATNIDTPTLPTTPPGNLSDSKPPSAPTDVAGNWTGRWSSPFGTIFTANLSLEAAGTSNDVQGTIRWEMKSTRQASKQSKVGLTAVEFVRGAFDPGARILTMAGYRKDDPNSIITLDKYRLVLGNDNTSLRGATWNHGSWRGQLAFRR